MTVCDSVIQGETAIQGVVIYPGNSKGLLFSDDRVFEFIPSTDFKQNGSHSLYIQSVAVDVENYFPGLYLKDGNSIFNVYGLFTDSLRKLYFILKNDAVTVRHGCDLS